MSVGTRTAGVLPLVGVLAAATVLTGIAVFSVADAGCASPGHYVHAGNHLELVGGCLTPGDLPSGSIHQADPATHPAGFVRSRP
ncbi:MAG: hypothetical protein ACRDRN_15070 [Sciscionella sp.]